MFFGSKKLLGLDIGSTSIKIAELDLTRGGATLQSFVMAPMPPLAVGAGELADLSSVGAVLQKLVRDIKSKRKSVAMGLWGTSVLVKRISVPKVEKKLIMEQLRFEAEQHIPFDINNVTLSYHILPFSTAPDTMDLLLIAAQNEVMRQYIQVVESAGQKCQTVDVSGFALANIFELNYGKLHNEVVAVFNIGAQVTNFVAIQNGEVIFCRDVPVGGSTYNAELSKNFGLTFQEAESLKLSAAKGQEVPEGVSQTITQVNEQIIEEIRSSIDFLSVTNQGVKLSRAWFTGGGSLTPGLIDQVSRTFEIKSEILNPFKKVTINRKLNIGYLQQVAPFVSISLGLGMRQAGDS
jgi:type IV pilus assembly protein PilM